MDCRSYYRDIDVIYRCFYFLFSKKCNIVNIKVLFFYWPTSTVFFNNLLFKFMNKCQKEMVRCAPPSSHVCDFFNNRKSTVCNLLFFTVVRQGNNLSTIFCKNKGLFAEGNSFFGN